MTNEDIAVALQKAAYEYEERCDDLWWEILERVSLELGIPEDEARVVFELFT